MFNPITWYRFMKLWRNTPRGFGTFHTTHTAIGKLTTGTYTLKTTGGECEDCTNKVKAIRKYHLAYYHRKRKNKIRVDLESSDIRTYCPRHGFVCSMAGIGTSQMLSRMFEAELRRRNVIQ